MCFAPPVLLPQGRVRIASRPRTTKPCRKLESWVRRATLERPLARLGRMARGMALLRALAVALLAVALALPEKTGMVWAQLDDINLDDISVADDLITVDDIIPEDDVIPDDLPDNLDDALGNSTVDDVIRDIGNETGVAVDDFLNTTSIDDVLNRTVDDVLNSTSIDDLLNGTVPDDILNTTVPDDVSLPDDIAFDDLLGGLFGDDDGECYSSCGFFYSKKNSNWGSDDTLANLAGDDDEEECCADKKSDCCELQAGLVAAAVVVPVALIFGALYFVRRSLSTSSKNSDTTSHIHVAEPAPATAVGMTPVQAYPASAPPGPGGAPQQAPTYTAKTADML